MKDLHHLLPRTMRARLAILFALSTSSILAVSGILLYEIVDNSIARSTEHAMRASLTAELAHLAKAENLDELTNDSSFYNTALHGNEDLDIALFDESGKLLAKSADFKMGAAILSSVMSAQNEPIMLESRDRIRRYLVTRAHTADTRIKTLHVAVQCHYGRVRAFLNVCALSIVLVVLAGAAMAATLAYQIAEFALKPLRQLAARADEISSSRLAHPLPDTAMAGELRELSHAFNRMLARLDDSFTRLTQFSSNLAHDIRTPLTNMLAQAQVALSQPRTNEQYRTVIESNIEECQRLSRMVDDMLFLARADARQRKHNFQSVDARQEAQRVARYYESIAQDAAVTLEVKGHASFEGDPLLVQRALSNLLSNALNHAPVGSTVTLECKNQDNFAQLSITDTGPGIGAAHLERIFDRFYRPDPARHNSASGTGLGLAIVKSIMEEHGGECRVTSTAHVRTTFSLWFPRLPKPRLPGDEPSAQARGQAPHPCDYRLS